MRTSYILLFLVCTSLPAQNKVIAPLVDLVNGAGSRISKSNNCTRVLDSLLNAQKYDVGFRFLQVLNKQYAQIPRDSFTPDLLNHTGNFYNATSNYTQSIEIFLKAIDLYQQQKRPRGICNVYTNLGNTYYYFSNYDKALDYYRQALAINEEKVHDDDIASNIYNNIGIIYSLRNNHVLGNKFFRKALQLYLATSDSLSIGQSYNNLATILTEENKLDSAFYYLKESTRLKEKFGSLNDKADAYNNIADLYLKRSQPNMALAYLQKTLSLLDTTLHSSDLENAYLLLSKVYENKKDPGMALRYYKLSRAVSDSIAAHNATAELLQKEVRIEVAKAHVADSLIMAEGKKLSNLELASKQRENGILLIFLSVAALIALLLYNRFRVTQKQKYIINEQKRVVEIRQKEMLDSIHYAKRIQQSLMTSERYIERVLNKAQKKI